MNTYDVYPKDTLDAEPLGTVEANDADEARIKADLAYGVSTTVLRRYDVSTISLDPLWILAAILLLAYMSRKKSH